MARRDPLNRARFRTAPDLGDVQLLRAEFETHRFERHVHDELVIAVTERGAGEFTSRGVGDIASTRAVAIFNPGEPHEGGVLDRTSGWCYRAIYLGPRILARLGEAVAGDADAVPYVRHNAVVDQRLASLVFTTHEALETATTRLTRETHLVLAYAHLYEHHASRSGSARPMTRARASVDRALDVMRTRFGDDLSLGELATAAGLSPYHFIRVFRREVGMTPHGYLMQIRLRHARARLAAGCPPTEAALAAGFWDQSHLTKHFKRSYGITPAQYAVALDFARPSTPLGTTLSLSKGRASPEQGRRAQF